MEQFYDDELVTLGEGTIRVDGIKVAGSITIRRDPRLSALARALADLPPLWKAPRLLAQLAPGSKWCCECGDVRPKSYFTSKRGTFDGLDPRCKACEAERQRRLYAQAVGRPVRPYTRREQVTV